MAAQNSQKKVEPNEVKKLGFWISQAVVIIATVCGVYLAASQGLKQALQFDSIKSDQNNYHLQKSLQNELSDNVGYIREYADKVNKRIVKPTLDMETFVWNSMTYAPNALETPSELLRETQKFYHKANDIMNTPHFNDNNKAKALTELADHIEKTVLPTFTTHLTTTATRLKAKGVEL